MDNGGDSSPWVDVTPVRRENHGGDSSPWGDVTPVRQENHENDTDQVWEPENHEGPSSVTPGVSASNQLTDIPTVQKGERSSRYSDAEAPFGHYGEVATEQLSPRLDKRSRVVCRYHAQGWCVGGNSCRFLHVVREASSSTLGASQQSGENSRLNDTDQVSKISCVFHARGWCMKGSSCRFLHTMERSDAVMDVIFEKVGQVHNESQTLKDFRAELTEFVKELLKPTWKKGLLSREAHKTIVRKVVDKVLSTLEPNQIPSSLESSKLYLSSSQSKLAKLVEGYIVKYGKW